MQLESTSPEKQSATVHTLRSKKVNWGPLGEAVFNRTYPRTKKDGTKETWAETVVRVVDGNIGLVDPKFIEMGEREKLIDLLFNFGIIPAGRHLSCSGIKGKQFLFNCLAGETKVLTKNGLIPIKDLAGKEVEILSQGEKEKSGEGCWKYGKGSWRKAKFQSFGSQELYKVHFSDGSEIYATKDHKWYVTKRTNPVTTETLEGHTVPFVTAQKPEKDAMYRRGVIHGFTYGDGTVSKHNDKVYSAHVLLFGEKDKAMIPMFREQGYEVTYPDYCDGYIGKLPSRFKDLPAEDAQSSYWHGFINGLIAADGTVDSKGTVILYQANKEALETIQRKATEIGLVTSPIYLQRELNPWTKEIAYLWRLTFRRFSVSEQDLIIQRHRENFVQAGEPSVSGLMVTKVEKTTRIEEVFCAVEPETHTFVIENSILTGNCHAAGWDEMDPAAHFTFTFDQLMQGGGVGSNYSNRYLGAMPPVKREIQLLLTCRNSHPNIGEFQKHLSPTTVGAELYYFVPDTREGWVEALEVILKSAYDYDGYNYSRIVIDVSDIRERGKPLVSSGGIACGPEPLVSMLMEFVAQLNKSVGHRLQSLQAMALDHTVASCVVAGGKRRSSRMAVKSWKDMDIFHFITCKNVDGDHWSTNISVETDNEFETAYFNGDERAVKIMKMIAEGKLKNGEPGIWNRSLSMKDERDPELMFCPNPCGEIGLQMWENCNLGHVNLQYFADRPLRHCLEAFRLTTRWLMRATYGDIPQDRQREVVDRNRRIGVGLLGFHGWLALNQIRYSDSWKHEWVKGHLAAFRKIVDEEATRYSVLMDIPRPVKTTTVAPTGTISLLPGVVSSVQALIAKWFKRLVRYYNMDSELALKKQQGYPTYLDKDAKNTEIVEYWCEDPLVSLLRSRGLDPELLIESQDEIALEDSLEVQAMIQDIYANNAIAYTINLPEDKVPTVEVLADALMKRHSRLKGTTLFVDKSRVNSPFQRITKEQFDSYAGPREIVQVEEVCVGGCPIK